MRAHCWRASTPASNTADTTPKVSASSGCTPKSMPRKRRVTASEAQTPTATPMPASHIPRRSTIAKRFAAVHPEPCARRFPAFAVRPGRKAGRRGHRTKQQRDHRERRQQQCLEALLSGGVSYCIVHGSHFEERKILVDLRDLPANRGYQANGIDCGADYQAAVRGRRPVGMAHSILARRLR